MLLILEINIGEIQLIWKVESQGSSSFLEYLIVIFFLILSEREVFLNCYEYLMRCMCRTSSLLTYVW